MTKIKEIRLEGWLLTKCATGSKYMFTGNGVFVHGDQIEPATNNKENTWINIFHSGTYVGSIWIDNKEDIDKLKEFIEA